MWAGLESSGLIDGKLTALVNLNGCDLFTFRGGKIALKSSYFKNRTA